MPVLEILGFTIGTSGLIPVVQLGLQAARSIREMRNVPTELLDYYIDFEIQSLLFCQWAERIFGREIYNQAINPVEAELPDSLDNSSPLDIKPALYNILWRVGRLLRDAHTYFAKMGVDIAPLSEIPKSKGNRTTINSATLKRQAIRSKFSDALSTKGKVLFGTKTTKESAKDTIETLLKDLEHCTKNLTEILDRQQENTARAAHSSRVLANKSNSIVLDSLQRVSSARFPLLSAAASFKHSRLRILNDNGSVALTPRKPFSNLIGCDAPESADSPTRKVGIYRSNELQEGSIRVIVEWKTAHKELRLNEQDIPKQRLSMLATILSLPQKPQILRTLDCLTWTSTITSLGLTFGLVYRVPEFACPLSSPVTLHQAFDTALPSLSERFRLAVTLSVSLMEYHSMGWLHKAFNARNILLFENANNKLDFSQPFIGGFEYSRPDDPIEISLPLDGPGRETLDTSQHPEVGRREISGRNTHRYSRRHDIYSLGVCLLEIGCWRSLNRICLDSNVTLTRDNSANELMIRAKQSIPHRMGAYYQQAILSCLEWSELSNTETVTDADLENFYLDVVQVLAKCHCSD
jgi:Prion-inhibition and propagation